MQAAQGLDAAVFIFAVGVIGAINEGSFGPFEEGPVVGARAGAAADRDDAGGEGGEDAGPVIRLLSAHGEADDSVQVGDA